MVYTDSGQGEKTRFVIPLDKLDNIETLCNELSITRQSFMKIAWALVLRTYLRTENVCFAVSEFSLDVTSSTLAMFSLHLKGETTTLETLRGFGCRYFKPKGPSSVVNGGDQVGDHCNSLMVFSEGVGSTPIEEDVFPLDSREVGFAFLSR